MKTNDYLIIAFWKVDELWASEDQLHVFITASSDNPTRTRVNK